MIQEDDPPHPSKPPMAESASENYKIDSDGAGDDGDGQSVLGAFPPPVPSWAKDFYFSDSDTYV